MFESFSKVLTETRKQEKKLHLPSILLKLSTDKFNSHLEGK